MARTVGCTNLAPLLLLCLFAAPGKGLHCGFPGSPAYGQPQPAKDVYREGETVSYTCIRGYSLQGGVSRQCLENGTWSGNIPICDTSLDGMDQFASSRDTLTLYTADKVIDGSKDTCTYTDKRKPRWIRVDLRNAFLIQAVTITVPKNMYTTDSAQFTIYVISVRESNTASYHKCAYLNGKFSTDTVKLTCSGGSILGRYVHIEDNRNNIDYFSMCEVEVFVQRDTYECGDPERPAQSYTVSPQMGVIDYHCVYGYMLEGSKRRTCLQSGHWSDSQPVCKEIICPPLENIPHGRIHFSPPLRGRALQGTTANFSCDYGYELSGVKSIQCLQSAQWSNGDVSCQPVDCEVPMTRNTQERYILLNESTTYGSMALLFCGDEEEIEGPSTMRTCREDGSWSPVSMDCSAQNMLSTLGLIDEEDAGVPVGIIVGLVIVIALLFILIVFIIVIRSKGLLRRPSDQSLPSKDTSSTLIANSSLSSDTKKGLHDNDGFYASVSVESVNGKSKDVNGKDLTRNGAIAVLARPPPPHQKPSLSAILFAKKNNDKKSKNEMVDGLKDSITSSTGACVYEEIGRNASSKGKRNASGVAVNGNANSGGQNVCGSIPPVYAQVDFDEKRRSRLVKSICGKIDSDQQTHGDGDYRSEEAPNFEDLDSEPIKLRELPPIPTEDDDASVIYASIQHNQTEIPESVFMRENAIYSGTTYSSGQDCDGNSIMVENDIYLTR